jgi:hypothetical protein
MLNRYFLESKNNNEDWFQKNLAPTPRIRQVTHIIANNQVRILNLDVSIFEFLIRRWLHWKHSFTEKIKHLSKLM